MKARTPTAGKKMDNGYSYGGKKNLSLRQYVNEKHFPNYQAGKPKNHGGIDGGEHKLPMYRK